MKKTVLTFGLIISVLMDGRLASPRRQDRLRPQHGSRLHHHGGVAPANLLRHPQLPRQHPRSDTHVRGRVLSKNSHKASGGRMG